jgi:sporulation integral membrane protein YtvI
VGHISKRILTIAGAAALLWFFISYLLEPTLPFLLGLALALLAEPAVGFLQQQLRLPRFAAVGIGLTGSLVLGLSLLILLCSFLIKELGILAGILPDLEQSARAGLQTLEDWLLGLAAGTPEGVRPLLTRTVLSLSGSGSSLMNQALGQLPRVATAVLGQVSSGLVGIGTGLLAAFLISARLPQLRQWFRQKLPDRWKNRYLPALKKVRHASFCWLKAQMKLSAVTFCIVTAGLMLLRVAYAPIWAFGIALVDAVPLLGTGIILLPWSLISLVQKNNLLAIGLLATYGAASICRTLWEPRLLGKQLGLDPLVTLMALYFGYQAWGILGMIFSPLLAVTAIGLTRDTPNSP